MNIIFKVMMILFSASFLFALNLPKNHIVDAKWLKKHLGDKNLIVVDVRKQTKKKQTYSKSHIDGAIHWGSKDFREGRYYNPRLNKPIPGYMAAPRTFQKTMRKSGANKKSAIVFYSGGNKEKDFRDGSLASFVSIYYGFNNVAILDGGFAGWVKSGGKVSSSTPKVKASNFKIKKFNRKYLATSEDVDEALTLKKSQFLDATGPGAHYNGTKKGDKRRMAEGHIPGAKALKTTKYVVKKDGVFYLDSKSSLIKKLKKAGVNIKKPLITYCNTGHLAAGNWFAQQFVVGMKHNKFYDGSMADYTALPNRPLDPR